MSRRRSLLGAAAALVVAPFAQGMAATVTPSSDAELIGLAREHERLGRQSNADFPEVDSDDDPLALAAEARRDLISEQQGELLERMVDLPPTTLAGVQALAAALVVWDLTLLNERCWHDAGDHMAALLVRSLLDMRGAA